MNAQLEAIVNALSANAPTYAVTVAGAVVIAALGWLASRWAGSLLGHVAERSNRVSKTLQPLLVKLGRGSVLFLTVVMVLSHLGVDTSSMIAVLGTFGLAIGLALKDTVGDVAAGVVLLILRPFEVGDAITVDGVTGAVEAIDIFETKIRTFDGVPNTMRNSRVRNAIIQNYSRAERRRTDLIIGISYSDDIGKALQICHEALEANECVLKDPEPMLKVSELADSSVNLLVRFWALPADFFPTSMDLKRDIKERFDAAGISIPFPQQDLHVVDVAPTKAA